MVFELFYVNWKELLSKINRNVHNNSYISLLCTFSFHLWAAKKMKSLKKQNSIVQMPFCLMENLILTTLENGEKYYIVPGAINRFYFPAILVISMNKIA